MSPLPACGPPRAPSLALHPPTPHPRVLSHAVPKPHRSTSDIASTGHALEKTWQGDREGK